MSIPLIGIPSVLVIGCLGGGGGSIGGAILSRGVTVRRSVRGLKEYVESTAVTEKFKMEKLNGRILMNILTTLLTG